MKTKKFLSLFLAAQFITASAFSAEVLKFKQGCSTGDDIKIVGVGDILLHGSLQIQATKSSKRFKSLWSSIIPLFNEADLAYANLEGPTADDVIIGGTYRKGGSVGFVYDNEVYTSYPRFNYHSNLAADIKESGIDVVSTANNHSLDREGLGVDKTIEALNAVRLPYTGTKTTSLAGSEQWHTITEAKGRRIAWLACTYSTNGARDKFGQVLLCFQQRELLLKTVAQLSNDSTIDAVIVTPHWGTEYALKHNSQQSKLAYEIIEAGAVAVIGTHPHVVQPWEKYTTKAGREGFIVYSTGNFVAGQSPIERRTSLMVGLSLTARPGEKLELRGVEFVPLLIARGGGIQSKDMRDAYLNAPEKIDPVAVKIWGDNYAKENIMKATRDESLKAMCDLSKGQSK
jgi:poly-gamma-glutamate synthesis protein (capsule biosynthesis protein)